MAGEFIKNKFETLLAEIQTYNPKCQLVAVSKKQPIEKIKFLYSLGQRIFAENYVQEFLEKQQQLKDLNIKWHFIGPLQSNKIRKIVGEVEWIHSVGSYDLALKISKVAQEKSLNQKILLQLNLAEEDSKSGFLLSEFKNLKKDLFQLPAVQICGFMCMPPLTSSPEDSQKYFELLKKIQVEIQKEYSFVQELSMGTTQDYICALQAGSTMIRIGEALLGLRVDAFAQ